MIDFGQGAVIGVVFLLAGYGLWTLVGKVLRHQDATRYADAAKFERDLRDLMHQHIDRCVDVALSNVAIADLCRQVPPEMSSEAITSLGLGRQAERAMLDACARAGVPILPPDPHAARMLELAPVPTDAPASRRPPVAIITGESTDG
jgi:hypothetical protein